jgi:sarcosine oxidase
MRVDHDVVIVGAGVVGSMTARALAARGRSVLLLERFELGHKAGSSHGLNRIVRVTDYHPDYVRLNRLALEGWRRLEDASGETLLVHTADVEIGDGAQRYADALEAAGESFAWIEPAAARERWPGLLVEDEERLFVQEGGCVCLADRTVRAAARVAQASGAELREHTAVERIVDHDSSAEVIVDGASIRASTVVVTAGAWAGGLLAGVGIDLPLVPSLEQVSYYRLESPSALPTVIDYTRDDGTDRYAVPHPLETGSFKLGLDHTGPPVDPDERSYEIDADRLARVETWGRRRFAELIPTDPPETCLYTNTPDNDYVLDRVGAIVIGSPCSGHGFKASPIVGEILANLATGDAPPVPLDRFSRSRASLRA